MEKYVLLFIFACSNLTAQAVKAPLIMSDGFSSLTLSVGVDSTATTGIDPHLGEFDLPPFPPAGVFEARFDLSPYGVGNLSTWHDFRYASPFPFTGTRNHRIIWQLGEGRDRLYIHYYLPDGVSMTIPALPLPWPLTGTGTVEIGAPFTGVEIIMTYDSVIPVELTSFTALYSAGTVMLEWETATETNNKGFEIERSSLPDYHSQGEMELWTSLGFVNGNGTSAAKHYYNFRDQDIAAGVTYYYRLKQIDYNASFSYSGKNIITASPADYNLRQNYPNPFNGSTIIEYTVPAAGQVSLSIYSVTGELKRIIADGIKQPGTYSEIFNADDLAGGVYFYRLQAGTFITSRKMILMK